MPNPLLHIKNLSVDFITDGAVTKALKNIEQLANTGIFRQQQQRQQKQKIQQLRESN